jgi:hypothetical protein
VCVCVLDFFLGGGGYHVWHLETSFSLLHHTASHYAMPSQHMYICLPSRRGRWHTETTRTRSTTSIGYACGMKSLGKKQKGGRGAKHPPFLRRYVCGQCAHGCSSGVSRNACWFESPARSKVRRLPKDQAHMRSAVDTRTK